MSKTPAAKGSAAKGPATGTTAGATAGTPAGAKSGATSSRTPQLDGFFFNTTPFKDMAKRIREGMEKTELSLMHEILLLMLEKRFKESAPEVMTALIAYRANNDWAMHDKARGTVLSNLVEAVKKHVRMDASGSDAAEDAIGTALELANIDDPTRKAMTRIVLQQTFFLIQVVCTPPSVAAPPTAAATTVAQPTPGQAPIDEPESDEYDQLSEQERANSDQASSTGLAVRPGVMVASGSDDLTADEKRLVAEAEALDASGGVQGAKSDAQEQKCVCICECDAPTQDECTCECSCGCEEPEVEDLFEDDEEVDDKDSGVNDEDRG